MVCILIGIALFLFGATCHKLGIQRSAFASERAEYLLASGLVQAAALAWIIPVVPAGYALLFITGQAASLALPALAGSLAAAPPRRSNRPRVVTSAAIEKAPVGTGWQPAHQNR